MQAKTTTIDEYPAAVSGDVVTSTDALTAFF